MLIASRGGKHGQEVLLLLAQGFNLCRSGQPVQRLSDPLPQAIIIAGCVRVGQPEPNGRILHDVVIKLLKQEACFRC